jgi:hypothetical protein
MLYKPSTLKLIKPQGVSKHPLDTSRAKKSVMFSAIWQVLDLTLEPLGGEV